MNSMHYIGFDIHKKVISFCEKLMDGTIVDQGVISATRRSLDHWVGERTTPWIGAMEATLFTGWIYDHLLSHAEELKVAHPEMLKAITASKKKNDAADAEKIADLLRCNLLPECYMAPEEHRELRRILRYRNFLVREAGKSYRGSISKKRNKHLQTVLIEAAKLAPRWNPQLAEVHERELAKGNRNRATLAIARKLVAYLFAVDRNQRKFVPKETLAEAA